MPDYILLPRIEVQNANAHSANWILNGPSVTAAISFAHALGLSEEFAEDIEGVALIHHDSDLQSEAVGRDHLLHQRRGASYINKKDYASGGSKLSLSLQPTASRHLIISVIIKLGDDHEVTQDELKRSKFLKRARFNGGQIISYKVPKLLRSLESVIENTPKGFWVIDRKDLVSDSSLEPTQSILKYLSPSGALIRDRICAEMVDLVNDDCSEEIINRIIQNLASEDRPPLSSLKFFVKKERDKLKNKIDNLKPGEAEKTENILCSVEQIGPKYSWLSATTLGYSLVSPQEKRQLSRNNYPHAFAEPMVGLVQYISTRSNPASNSVFWYESWLDNNTYVISQPA